MQLDRRWIRQYNTQWVEGIVIRIILISIIKLEQQLNTGDNQDQFNVYILNMASSTNDPSNMRYEKMSLLSIYLIILTLSLTLNFLIAYTRECISCDNHRQSIIFKQFCSNNQLSTPIRFLIEYANLSYTFSNPVILHTSRVPIQNITIITSNIFTWISIIYLYNFYRNCFLIAIC
jgi:hypothetical protein